MIKDVAIKTQDGVNIKTGGKVFIVEKKQVCSYEKKGRTSMKPLSGEKRGVINVHEIIDVNQNANIRSFTVRSKDGCEMNYSTRNTCLPPTMFGKEISAERYCRKIDFEDMRSIDEKISSCKTRIQHEKEMIDKWEKTKKKIRAV